MAKNLMNSYQELAAYLVSMSDDITKSETKEDKKRKIDNYARVLHDCTPACIFEEVLTIHEAIQRRKKEMTEKRDRIRKFS